MKKRLAMCLLACLMTSIPTWAYDFELNGVYYNITDANAKTVEVTYVENDFGNSDFYYGAITIPKRISKDNVTYDVTSIGNLAFIHCKSLTSVTIPNSVTSIGCDAFSYSSLTSITIPNSVTSIGTQAFLLCSSLTSITIPNSVTYIGSNAFSFTAWYNNQPDGLIYAGKVAYGYKGTMPDNTKIVLEEGTLGIGGCAFYNCSGLTSITIPNSVTSIGGSAFYGCSGLTSITIPNSVTSIGDNAFNGCNGLTSVVVEATTPLNIGNAFNNYENVTLYVPIGSKAAYQASSYWKLFGKWGEIVELVELYPMDYTANRGAEFDLPILMDNGDEAITAFQFDVELPEGVTLLSAKLSNRKADQSNPVPTSQSDGSYRLATFSSSGSTFSGSEGTILNLRLKVSTDAALGKQTVTLKNIELTTTSKAFELVNHSSTITVLDVLTGDASGDGKVSIFDAVQIVNYILGNTPETFIESAADVDGNGKITIFDAVSTVNIILNQGATNNARMTTLDNEREPQ